MTQMATTGEPMVDVKPVAPVPTVQAAAVQIVRGQPDDIELAALVAGLAASTVVEESLPTHEEAWSDRSRLLRDAARPVGPDAWRWSLRG